jgi:hypothetical protein
MKKMTFTLLLGIAVAAIASVNPLSWTMTNIDLGEVSVGEIREVNFDFTNESINEVMILEAKGSCGCTDVQYPKEAIASGDTARISAKFTAKGTGTFKKNIKIKINASEEYTYLNFQGEVKE